MSRCSSAASRSPFTLLYSFELTQPTAPVTSNVPAAAAPNHLVNLPITTSSESPPGFPGHRPTYGQALRLSPTLGAFPEFISTDAGGAMRSLKVGLAQMGQSRC